MLLNKSIGNNCVSGACVWNKFFSAVNNLWLLTSFLCSKEFWSFARNALSDDVFFAFFDVTQSSIEVPATDDAFGFGDVVDSGFKFPPCCYASRLLKGEYSVVREICKPRQWLAGCHALKAQEWPRCYLCERNWRGTFEAVSKAKAYSPVAFFV